MELNKILHPDLLPADELRQILESLSIEIPNNLPQVELLKIFKRVAVPLPQRNKEVKSQLNLKDTNVEINLDELCLSNDKNDDDGNQSHNVEKKNANDAILQLEIECEKMIVDVESIKVSNSINRKVMLKRSHLFQKDDNGITKRCRF